uniref:OSIGBa0146N20.7 protein n=1 Tax=Saccharum officinarum TaxID=4547 RepID=A0A678THW1_SACOF|nr:OSIGBa0146N20.7 protein [Saccharum officinarum]
MENLVYSGKIFGMAKSERRVRNKCSGKGWGWGGGEVAGNGATRQQEWSVHDFRGVDWNIDSRRRRLDNDEVAEWNELQEALDLVVFSEEDDVVTWALESSGRASDGAKRRPVEAEGWAGDSCLKFGRTDKGLIGYVDSDYAADLDRRRSITAEEDAEAKRGAEDGEDTIAKLQEGLKA